MSGVRIARKLFAAPAIAPYIVTETNPGPAMQDDAALEAWMRKTGSTVHHLVGTCRMGADEGAVVDARLRVRGVEGLRVVDASIMPTITTGNTNAPTLMIGARAAALVMEDNAN